MDYRGIITRGYHVDAGGQNKVEIVTSGYAAKLSQIEIVEPPHKYGNVKYGTRKRYGAVVEIYAKESFRTPAYSVDSVTTPVYQEEAVASPTYS